jgi:hypothetical protein
MDDNPEKAEAVDGVGLLAMRSKGLKKIPEFNSKSLCDLRSLLHVIPRWFH